MLTVSTPLGQRTPQELFANAAKMEALSATATTPDVRRALKTLAERYRLLAIRRQAEELAAKSDSVP